MESVVAVFESIPGLKELKVRSPRTTAVKLAVDMQGPPAVQIA